jgi:hypothetical protein
MKRKLAAAILGLTVSIASTTSANAQGRVLFANYGYNTHAPITYTPGGAGVNNAYRAGLWYFLGTAALPATYGNDTLPAGWELSAAAAQINSGATAGPSGAGLFTGSTANIGDYVSGPITFVVTAYDGADYNSSLSRAHSEAFTLPSIATGGTTTGEFGPGLKSFAIIPEPSIFAISGLSSATLMLIRRKK